MATSPTLLPPVLLAGAGFAAATAALTLAVVCGAPSGDAGVAATLNTTFGRIGGLVAVAAVGVIAAAGGVARGGPLGRPPAGPAHDRVLSSSLAAYHDAMLVFACAALLAAAQAVAGLGRGAPGMRGG